MQQGSRSGAAQRGGGRVSDGIRPLRPPRPGGAPVLGFTGSKKAIVSDDEGSDAEAGAAAPQAAVGPQGTVRPPVTTVLRDDGTELPRKLNSKVFVDGLPYNEPSSGPGLEALMDQFITEWRIGKMTHFSKKPGQGFGYVTFRSPNSVEVAVNVLGGRKFLGRPLRIEVPKPPMEHRPGFAVPPGGGYAATVVRQVLVSDMTRDTQAAVMREVLRESAPHIEERIEAIKIVGGGRKAFVTLFAAADVLGFVAFMDGFKLLGRTVHAEPAQPPGSLPFSGPRPAPRAAAAPPAAAAAAEPSAAAPAAAAGGAAPFARIAGANADRPFPLPDLLVAGATAAAAAPTGTPLGDGRTSRYHYEDSGSTEVIVGNVSEDTTDAELRAHFAPCGRIVSAEMLINAVTRAPSGLAKVAFAIPAHARYAKEQLDRSRLTGATIRVDRVDEESPEPFIGGGGGGGGGDGGDVDPAAEAEAEDFAAGARRVARRYGPTAGDGDSGSDGGEGSEEVAPAPPTTKKTKRAAPRGTAAGFVKKAKEIDADDGFEEVGARSAPPSGKRRAPKTAGGERTDTPAKKPRLEGKVRKETEEKKTEKKKTKKNHT